MKRLLLASLCFFGFSVCGISQEIRIPKDTTFVVFENSKLKLTEYISTPGKDVCGPGMHSHVPHLSILLTDASVSLTTEDGKTQDINLKSGATFWSDAETHMVLNDGNNTVKVYLVELE